MSTVTDGITYTAMDHGHSYGHCNTCGQSFTGPAALSGAADHVRATGHAVTTRMEVVTLTELARDAEHRDQAWPEDAPANQAVDEAIAQGRPPF